MKKFSAKEDFMSKTLGKMSGSLTKADYLAGLLDESGCLSHWGLERAHGIEAAQAAMKSAYAEQLQGLLRTSIRELWQEVEGVGTQSEAKNALLKRICQAIESKCGKQLNQVQLCHLKAVLDALLEVALQDQNHPGA